MKRLSWAAATAILTFAPLAAQAQIKLLPPCTATGNCGISDMLAVFVNLAEFLLGIVGAVALGYFVYGGFVFILSRGNKGEVDRAFGILRSAAIGIAIIFLSGVFVRFTTRALTGGTSAIPTIGESCDSKGQTSAEKGDGLWVSIPAGVSQDGKIVPEGLICVKKETGACKDGSDCRGGKCTDGSACGNTPGMECQNLNGILKERGRATNAAESYYCQDVTIYTGTSCVRGLCAGLSAQYACCLGKPSTESK